MGCSVATRSGNVVGQRTRAADVQAGGNGTRGGGAYLGFDSLKCVDAKRFLDGVTGHGDVQMGTGIARRHPDAEFRILPNIVACDIHGDGGKAGSSDGYAIALGRA